MLAEKSCSSPGLDGPLVTVRGPASSPCPDPTPANHCPSTVVFRHLPDSSASLFPLRCPSALVKILSIHQKKRGKKKSMAFLSFFFFKTVHLSRLYGYGNQIFGVPSWNLYYGPTFKRFFDGCCLNMKIFNIQGAAGQTTCNLICPRRSGMSSLYLGGKVRKTFFFFFQGPFWSSWVGKMEILLKTIRGILAMAK